MCEVLSCWHPFLQPAPCSCLIPSLPLLVADFDKSWCHPTKSPSPGGCRNWREAVEEGKDGGGQRSQPAGDSRSWGSPASARVSTKTLDGTRSWDESQCRPAAWVSHPARLHWRSGMESCTPRSPGPQRSSLAQRKAEQGWAGSFACCGFWSRPAGWHTQTEVHTMSGVLGQDGGATSSSGGTCLGRSKKK